MIDRRLITNFDWFLLLILFGLAAVSAVNLYSAASSFGAGTPVFLKQLYWFGIGLVAMLVVAMIGHLRLATLAYPLYGLLLVLLLAVLFWGKVAGGSQRWLSLGPLVLQPSELAKPVIILILASYFRRRDTNEPYTLRQLVIPLALAAAPSVLVLKQPDLGTCLLLMIVATSVILVNGVRLTSLGLAAGTILAVLPVAWRFLKDYQKRRIFSFLDPESDPLGASYHLIQSKIAVGSGGLTGKGFMMGTQSQLHFLPEQHTDFAFSVLAEEWGFVGGILVIVLLVALVVRCLVLAFTAKDRLSMLVVVGAAASVFWPAVINIGMVIGLFPVVGVPLPFISYGGSSMVTTMAIMGLVQSVAMRRFVFTRQ